MTMIGRLSVRSSKLSGACFNFVKIFGPDWVMKAVAAMLSRVATLSGTDRSQILSQLQTHNRNCTAPFAQVKLRSSPARGYKIGCVCSYMAGITPVWGYKLGVFDLCLFALLKRGCANSGGLGARWNPPTCPKWKGRTFPTKRCSSERPPKLEHRSVRPNEVFENLCV